MSKLLLLVVFVVACAGTAPPRVDHPPAEAFRVTVSGHGPPVVFLPGLSSPGSVWERAVAHLAPRYTCHVFTLAGFAGVPAAPGDAPFLTRERDAILAYLHEHHLEGAVLVGHSLGGVLAYAIAARAPQVAAVVAIDGLPFMPALGDPRSTPESMAPQAQQLRAMFATLDRAAFARQTRGALAQMITSPEDVERVAREAERSDPRVVGQAVHDVMITDLRDEVAAIRAPIWLVQAGAGQPAGMAEAYAAQIERAPRHHLVVAPDAKHFVMLDAPELVARTLDEALAEAAR